MKKDTYASEDFTEKYLELSKLPEPLRLAAGLEETMQWPLHGKAADCLRRLHEENERLKAAAPMQEPPPECQTEAEKRAYAFGWWKAMEYVRKNGVIT